MIKRNQIYFNWINRLLDLALLYLSFLGSVAIWLFQNGHDMGNVAYHYALENPLPALLVFCLFVFVFQYAGLYDSFRASRLLPELGKLLFADLLGCAFALGILFLFRVRDFSRGVAVLFFLLSYLLLSLKRVCLRLVLRTARARGYNQKHVLLVGGGYLAGKYSRCILNNPQYGFHCLGYVGEASEDGPGIRLGGYRDLPDILDRYDPDEIIIALEQDEGSQMPFVISCCEKQGIRACIIPYYNDYLPASATIDAMEDVRLLNIRSIPLDIVFNQAVKRLFDIVFSLAVLVFLSPVYLLLALGVRLSGPGPILFRQVRVGKERKNFTMYKFRSMRVNDSSDTAWSKSRDSRITPFGAFIRKFSLDELPQFFNVLKGDMSVVGPRPELPFFVQQYRDTIPRYMIKHQVKPGITGWAQVNGYRGDTSIAGRIDYDLWYIENWSLFLDIKIILLTVFGGMINGEKNLSFGKRKESGDVEGKDREETRSDSSPSKRTETGLTHEIEQDILTPGKK